MVALAADWLHLAATALWIGGLFQLLLVFPVALAPLPPPLRLRALAGAVPRFSRLAVACVAVLVVTGAYQLWLHVGSIEALFTTVYGVTLPMKLALILPLLALGAFNLLVTRPGFRLLVRESGARVLAAADLLTRRFRLAVAGEVDLGGDGAAARGLSHRRVAGARARAASPAGNRRNGYGGRLAGAVARRPRRR